MRAFTWPTDFAYTHIIKLCLTLFYWSAFYLSNSKKDKWISSMNFEFCSKCRSMLDKVAHPPSILAENFAVHICNFIPNPIAPISRNYEHIFLLIIPPTPTQFLMQCLRAAQTICSKQYQFTPLRLYWAIIHLLLFNLIWIS